MHRLQWAGDGAERPRPWDFFGHSFPFCLDNVGFLRGIIKALRHQRIVVYENAE
jgi:hypothetical protein